MAAEWMDEVDDAATGPAGPGRMPSADEIGSATANATYDIYNPPSDPHQFELARKYATQGDELDVELNNLLSRRNAQVPSTVERLKAARARLEGRPLQGAEPSNRTRVMAAAGAPGTWADNTAARAKALLQNDADIYDQQTDRQTGLDAYDSAIEKTEVGGVDAQIAALQKRIAERNDLRQKYMGMRPPTAKSATSGGGGTAIVKAGLEAETDQVQVEAQLHDLDQLISWGDQAEKEGMKFSGATSWQAFSPYLGGMADKIFGPGSKEHFMRQTGGFGDELRQKAERIVQSSLRPILGAQFTQVEGMNLLARAYDVTKPWPANRARMLALKSQLTNLSDVNRERVAIIRASAGEKLTPEAQQAAHDLKLDLEREMERAGDAALASVGVGRFPEGQPAEQDAAAEYDPEFLRQMADPNYRQNASADELEVYADYLEQKRAPKKPAAKAPVQPKETSGVIDWLMKPGLKKATGGVVKMAEGGLTEEERRAQALARIEALSAEAAPEEEEVVEEEVPAEGEEPLPASLQQFIDEKDDPSIVDQALDLAPDVVRAGVAGYAGYKAKPLAVDAYNAVASNPGQRDLAQGYIDDQSNIEDALSALRRKQTTYGQSGAELIDVMPRSVRDQVVAPALAAAPAAGRQLQSARKAQNEEAKKTRIPQAVITGLTADAPYEAARQKLVDARKAAADPEFANVWQAHPNLKGTNELNGLIGQLMNSRVGAIAVRRANEEWTRLQRDGKVPAGNPVGKSPAGFGPYTTEYLHTIQSHLYDLTRSTSGLDSEEAKSLRSPLVDYMDTNTGGPQSPYNAARTNYAEHSRGLEAMEDGLEKALKMRPDEFSSMWQQMDATQKEHMRTGIANAIDRDVGNRASDTNPAHALLNKPSTRQILEIAAETPAKFNAMIARLESERDSWDIANQEAKRKVAPITAEQRKKSKGNAVDNKVTRLVAGLDRLRQPMHWFTSQEERTGEPMSRKRGEQTIEAARSKTPDDVGRLAKLQKRMAGRTSGSGLLGLLSAAIAAGAPYLGDDEDEDFDAQQLEALRARARQRRGE